MNFHVHLEGKSGIGKSPLPKFGASIFGNPDTGKLSKTFAATAKNRIESAVALSDFPIILEELESLKKFEQDQIAQTIYDYSLGVANQARTRKGTSRPIVNFSGVRISTGERALLDVNDKRGAFKRILNIRAEKLFSDTFAANLHIFTENNFGLFGRQWVNFIIENKKAIREEFFGLLEIFQAAEIFNGEPTHLKNLLACFVAYENFVKCADIPVEVNIVADFEESLKFLPSIDDISDTKRALEMLSSFVAANAEYFIKELTIYGDDGYKKENSSNTEHFGKIYQDTRVAFYPHKLKEILEVKLGFASCQKLLSEWRDEGIIDCRAGKLTKQARLDGIRATVIFFKSNTLINA